MGIKKLTTGLVTSAVLLTTNTSAKDINSVEQNITTFSNKASTACLEAESKDTLEEKGDYIKLTQEMRKLIKIIDTDNNNTSDENQTNVFKDDKMEIYKVDGFYDIYLEGNFEKSRKTYNTLHINYGPTNDFLYIKYSNKGNSFPKLRITKSAVDNGIDLCSEERYYDAVKGYNLKTNSSQGESIDYNHTDFKEMMGTAIDYLKAVKLKKDIKK